MVQIEALFQGFGKTVSISVVSWLRGRTRELEWLDLSSASGTYQLYKSCLTQCLFLHL